MCQNPIPQPANVERHLPMDTNNNNNLHDRRRYNVTVSNERIVEADRTVTMRYLLFLGFPILTHFYDLVTDLYLTIEYFEIGKTLYGCLTLTFIILPAITSTWVSSRIYQEDWRREVGAENEESERILLVQVPKLRTSYAIEIFLQLALPLRYFRSLCYARLVRKNQQAGDVVTEDEYYSKMGNEQQDVALLNVLGCILETAPQLVLQLTIVLTEKAPITTSMWFKFVGGCIALITFGVSMMTYHRAIRLARVDKPPISLTGSALIFIWQFGTIAARIILIGVSASLWPTYTISACVISCIGWTAVLFINGDGVVEFCRDKTTAPFAPRSYVEIVRVLFFSGILAVVYMFTFVNLKEGRTFLRYLVYNVICIAQNAPVILLWFMLTNLIRKNVYYTVYLLSISVAFYFIGIIAMVTYYMFFHTTVREEVIQQIPLFRGLSSSM